MKIRAFITHKKAETFADCQDRFCVNENTRSIAVSDGMSQSWQQKIWAQLLVKAYTESEDWIPSQESIKPLCQQWRKEVVDYIDHLKSKNAKENIIYRNERNLAEGRSAGATFVGIRFCGLEWKGHVLGDSCLIEWNGNEAVFYTSQNVDSFDNHPDYFDSNIFNEGKGTPICKCGNLEKDTCLLLVSDPFSDYLFEQSKQGNITEYIQRLLELSSHEDFEILVDEWREAGMHNDDTTLVIIESDDCDDFSIHSTTLDDINKLIDEEKKLIEEDKKKEEVEQIAAPIYSELTGSVADTATNAIVEEEKQEEQSEKQIDYDQFAIPSDKAIEEHKEGEEEMPKLVPVEAKDFVVDLLKEYKKAIENPFGQVLYYFSEKAVEKAGYSVFKKYNIFNKKE